MTDNNVKIPKFDKIKVTSDKSGKNTFVYLNNALLNYLIDFKFEVSATGFNKVTFTLMADVEIDANVNTENIDFVFLNNEKYLNKKENV